MDAITLLTQDHRTWTSSSELGATYVMEQRLGELGEVYAHEQARAFGKAAKSCAAAGLALVTLGGSGRARSRRLASLAGAGLQLAGSVSQRWAVYKAGFQSAADPRYTVRLQHERLAAVQGASRDGRAD